MFSAGQHLHMHHMKALIWIPQSLGFKLPWTLYRWIKRLLCEVHWEADVKQRLVTYLLRSQMGGFCH